jgi:hypothetical protein
MRERQFGPVEVDVLMFDKLQLVVAARKIRVHYLTDDRTLFSP